MKNFDDCMKISSLLVSRVSYVYSYMYYLFIFMSIKSLKRSVFFCSINNKGVKYRDLWGGGSVRVSVVTSIYQFVGGFSRLAVC